MCAGQVRKFFSNRHGLAITVLGWWICAASLSHARQGETPPSWSEPPGAVDTVPVLELAPVVIEDEKARDSRDMDPAPLRFADPRQVDVRALDEGTWKRRPEGGWIWRLRVLVPGATDLNFGFTGFRLPQGASLYFISETEQYYEGPYTHHDNKPHGEFWSPVVPGDRATIELYYPDDDYSGLELTLIHVGAGYRDLFHDPDLSKQGSCNIDVVCPQGDPWRNEIRSVARYTINGTSLCTGTLVMDAHESFRNFFLTAAHCGLDPGNDRTVVVYWNFESPVCGDLGGGSLANNQTGSTFRASRSDVDMALLELDQAPDPSFEVFYSGWDRSGSIPGGGVGIHHPRGAVKAISFNTDPLFSGDSCIGSGGRESHWYVDNWETGTTEPGSSGSGLWNPSNRKLVGFLSGGGASCLVRAHDCYGKLSAAWNGPSPNTRLKDWLDPNNTGALQVEGRNPGDPGDHGDRTGNMICASPGLTIPDADPSGVHSLLTVSDGGTITDLDVLVQVDHTWVGDLIVELRHVETGQTATLVDRPIGVSGANDGACGNVNLNAVLDDEADTFVDLACRPGTRSFEGRFRPMAALSRFDGLNLSGDWVLSVSDHAFRDTGSLVKWCLVTPAAPGAATDFNADRISDVFWRNRSGGSTMIWLLGRNGVLSQESPGRVAGSWFVEGLDDFNGDGITDILWRHRSSGATVLWAMNGSAAASKRRIATVSAVWQAAGSGDFNGDGKADILWRHPASGATVVWLMNGERVVSRKKIGAVSVPWHIAGVADFNGDGMADILWRNSTSGNNIVWLMSTFSVAAQRSIGTVADPAWKVAEVGDLNDDGRTDIIWRHSGNGVTLVWQMDGTRILAQKVIGVVRDSRWVIEDSGDYNADGKDDLLWRHTGSGTMITWDMNGLSRQSVRRLGTVRDPAWEIR